MEFNFTQLWNMTEVQKKNSKVNFSPKLVRTAVQNQSNYPNIKPTTKEIRNNTHLTFFNNFNLFYLIFVSFLKKIFEFFDLNFYIFESFLKAMKFF